MTELRILRLIAGHLPRIGLAALISAAAELSGIALIATAAWLLSTAAGQPALTTLTVAIVGVRTFAISRGTLRYLDRLVGHDAVLRALAGLRATVFKALTPLAPAGDRVFRGGDLLSRLVSDVDAVQDLVLRVMTPIWTAAVVCLAAVGFTAAYSPAAALVLAAGLVVAGVVLPVLSARLAVSAAKRGSESGGAFAAAAADLSLGAADLAAYGATDAAVARAQTQAEAIATAQRQGSAVSAGVTAMGTVVAGATVIGVFLVAPGLGVMTAVLALTALVTFESVAGLPAAARRLTEVRAAAARLTAILDSKPTVAEPLEPLALPEGDRHLVLSNVRPVIPGRDNPGAGIDLDLPPGKRVAILGASGAGKTMLLNLLVRFTDIAQGTATLGGVALDRLPGDEVRRVIGGMLGDTHLFDSSVRQNLLVADPDADDGKLAAVLAQAGLPGLDPSIMVGHDGGAVSGGQRQRLLLARALLADHPIMLLDEPIEHLDGPTADSITADLLAATTRRSLVLVTHRLSGLAEFDEILVLDGGAVVQRGTHAELSAQSGPYAELHEATQAGLTV